MYSYSSLQCYLSPWPQNIIFNFCISQNVGKIFPKYCSYLPCSPNGIKVNLVLLTVSFHLQLYGLLPNEG